jgi:hypothetical protein
MRDVGASRLSFKLTGHAMKNSIETEENKKYGAHRTDKERGPSHCG